MKHFFGIALSFCVALAFWACSQSVSGSDSDSRSKDEPTFIPGFHPVDENGSTNGSSAKENPGSSDSKVDNPSSSSEVYPDDNGDDNGGGDLGSSSSASSGLNVTQYIPDQKLDCLFSVDDDVWEFEATQADTSMHAVLEYRENGVLWGDATVEQKFATEDECKENEAMMAFIAALTAESGNTDLKLTGHCDGTVFFFTMNGPLENYTPESRRENYAEMCK